MATLEERIYEGNRARECLENEAFIWAFEGYEQELTEAWRTSPARDAEGREKIYLSLQLLNKLKAKITQSLETGQLADLELQHRKTLADRAKEILRF
ncbi:hypothetical protein [Pseudomonas sp. dw_612]|uniref:hypothetical protein n=1 Tax=Pseudomonas sp. dw_612 TaxID=2720080 RepID=UPI001BD3D562|nr:hypothetical protein [Pseudomonas sp. dw_612]